jgi:uncharacterized alpha-E superfamily protein
MDLWRVISSACLPDPNQEPSPATPAHVLDQLNRVIITLSAFGGMATEGMTRTEGWRFLDLGRRLERAMNLMHLVRGTLVQPNSHEAPILDAVLEIADCSMTYRRRYMSTLRVEPVLDLLLADGTNPRSMVSQLSLLAEHVAALPRTVSRAGLGPEERLVLQGQSWVLLSEVDILAKIEKGIRPELKQLLDDIAALLPQFSDTITQHYLTHLLTSRHLASF